MKLQDYRVLTMSEQEQQEILDILNYRDIDMTEEVVSGLTNQDDANELKSFSMLSQRIDYVDSY